MSIDIAIFVILILVLSFHAAMPYHVNGTVYQLRYAWNWIRGNFCPCRDCQWWRSTLRRTGTPPPFLHPY